MESLFFPIFKGLQASGALKVHVMQFSWAGPKEVQRISTLADSFDISYIQFPIHRKPIAAIGAIWSVYQGVFYLKKYITEHQIQILMPRSTMPAMMVNRLWGWLRKQSVSVIFDADGLPLEERVNYAGLDPLGRQYRLLKKEEEKILRKADKVLTRSQKSIDIHLATIGERYQSKFFTVSNGRDADFFRPDPESRWRIREAFGLADKDKLWVYTGTIGPQYMVEEMLGLFGRFHLSNPGSKFLILTRNTDFLEGKVPEALRESVIVQSGSYTEIPLYLSAADLGLSLRKAASSLAGIAPIKLGEYLLCGLPVIASPGVGDTEELLKDQDFCFLVEEEDLFSDDFQEWVGRLDKLDRGKIREFGLGVFSLEKSVEGYLRILN
jgi:glycosyltransferase involved in cell wall biosynthesis